MGEMMETNLQIALDQLNQNGVLHDNNILVDVYDCQVNETNINYKDIILFNHMELV